MQPILRRFGMSEVGKYIEQLRRTIALKGGSITKEELNAEAVRSGKSLTEAAQAINSMTEAGMFVERGQTIWLRERYNGSEIEEKEEEDQTFRMGDIERRSSKVPAKKSRRT
jgi:hypothetical protein